MYLIKLKGNNINKIVNFESDSLKINIFFLISQKRIEQNYKICMIALHVYYPIIVIHDYYT